MSDDDELTEKQRRVVDAAMDVFAERGFGGASTSEIAKRAGVAEGTIFKNYKTKKDLLIGVVSPVFVKIVAPALIKEVRDIILEPHVDVETFLRRLWSNRIEFIRKHARVVRIALQEVPFHPEIRAIAIETLTREALPHVLQLFERFQREGKMRAGPPLTILRLVIGTLFVYGMMRVVIVPDGDWDDDAEIDFMAKVIAQGLAPPR